MELLSVDAFDCGVDFLGSTVLPFADFLGATTGLFVESGLLPEAEFDFVTTVDFSEN
ncbi:MAG: hypothetical protein ACKOEF_10405 [Acidimicrobiaceae bacterium]